MRAPGMIRLAIPLLAVVSGCSLLVSAQLSDKPGEADGGGGAGGEGGAASSSAVSSSKASSTVAASSSKASSSSVSSSSGCSGDTVTCPPNPMICKINLKNDPMNCGACYKVCFPPTPKCDNGTCGK